MPQKTLSAYEKAQKSPFKWIILLCLILLFIYFFVFSQTFEWLEKKSFVQNEASVLELLRKTDEKLTNELHDEQKRLNDFREAKAIEELQQFPETIDAHKIVKIIELYALQLKNLKGLYQESRFELNRVEVGRTIEHDEDKYSETTVSLSFQSDEENLKEFLLFLQTGNFSDRFQSGIENGQIYSRIAEFLKTNLLPIVHIDSLKYRQVELPRSEEDMETEDSTPLPPEFVFDTNLKIKLFSQLPQKDE